MRFTVLLGLIYDSWVAKDAEANVSDEASAAKAEFEAIMSGD